MANKKDKGKIVIRRARLADALKIKNTHVASIRGICSKDYTNTERCHYHDIESMVISL